MIYETSGRAREYFELAANLYTGCEHACVYCYGADVMHIKRDEFFNRAVPKQSCDRVLAAVRKDAESLARKYETRHVLLSFVTDSYQPAEESFNLTRRAIQILHENGLGIAILTKAGLRASRDFDLLNKGDLYGTTLTFLDIGRSVSWEPVADTPYYRMQSLAQAKARGIGTWVSCEPVIDPQETLQLIERTAEYVDVFKVGTLNYANKLPPEFKRPEIDWKTFAQNVVILLDRLGANYYIKKDLAQYIGRPEGISVGKVPK
jgi:DNA repair photolyase